MHVAHTRAQIFELMRGLDKDCDATIDLEEFAARFEMVFTRLNEKLGNSAAAGGVGMGAGAVLTTEQALVMQRLARNVYRKWSSLEQVSQSTCCFREQHSVVQHSKLSSLELVTEYHA